MARKIASRLRITGTLVASGPLHVGGAGGNADVDLALAVNGKGQLYVPGTSLAGPMRAWLHQQVGEAEVSKTWGYQERPTEGEPEGHASFVIVEDGPVTLPAGAVVETRDGVGIDRVTGAAAEHIKYNRAVLPSGSEIKLEVTVELGEENKGAGSLIIAALHAMERGEIRVGASKTRGLGKVRLKHLNVREQELLSFRGMLDTIGGKTAELDARSLIAQSLPGIPTLHISIDWEPRGPLMVKADRDGIAVDMLPLVSASPAGDMTFILPGSSIKGALRSQAERIVRTVKRESAPRIADSRKAFLKQIEIVERSGNEETERSLISALFGAAGKPKRKDIADDGPPLLGLGALSIEDCYAVPRFTRQQWEAIEAAPDADDTTIRKASQSPLQQALQIAGLNEMQQAFHVAIDRWTGGAADGFLYSVLEPHGVAWSPMQLTLDLARVREGDRRPAVMCLLLALRDLIKGRIPLGFATNRGMGAIQVNGIGITPTNLNDGNALIGLKDVEIADGKLGGWSDQLRSSLENGWGDWLAENRVGEVR